MKRLYTTLTVWASAWTSGLFSLENKPKQSNWKHRKERNIRLQHIHHLYQPVQSFLTNTFHKYKLGSTYHLWHVLKIPKLANKMLSWAFCCVFCSARVSTSSCYIVTFSSSVCFHITRPKAFLLSLNMELTKRYCNLYFDVYLPRVWGLYVFSAVLTLMDCFPWTWTKR